MMDSRNRGLRSSLLMANVIIAMLQSQTVEAIREEMLSSKPTKLTKAQKKAAKKARLKEGLL